MPKYFNKTILIFLSFIFSIGLIFASLELPYLFDRGLQKSMSIPGFDQQSDHLNITKTEMWMEYYHVKTIGYIGLGLIILLIIIGFKLENKSMTLLGTFGFFLPIFGHFAITMFFLAGLGFLRILWIPLNDISPLFMRLGDILFLPYEFLKWLGQFFVPHPQKILAVVFVFGGIFFLLLVFIPGFKPNSIKKML